MPLTLHAAVVPGWLQILGSVRHLIDKAEIHCNEHGLDPAELLKARLAPDMMRLPYQVLCCRTHTEGAIKAALTGHGSPDMERPPETFAGLAALLDQAITYVAAVDPQALEEVIGRDVVFTAGDRRWDFTAENFLLGFSQPNFYFHATTAYDILRMKGVEIGKRHFLGAKPLKT